MSEIFPKSSKNFLKIYEFFNGFVSRNASLCNCYYVLNKLKIADCKSLLHAGADAMCWVRDYVEGCTIKTHEQLDTVLLNEPTRLRISFFATDIKTIKDLKFIAEHEMFPDVHKELPTGAEVYTLWFSDGEPRITRSGITNIEVLFTNMTSMYTMMIEYEPQFNTKILDTRSVDRRQQKN